MSVSATIGPISGINYGNLITGLTATDQAEIDQITTQTNTLDEQSNALLGLAALMTGLQVSAANFDSPAIFSAATATSSQPGVINPSAGIGTAVGDYSFNVQQLASSSQVVTQGFSDANNTALGLSGNITLSVGGKQLGDVQNLSQLNGGKGVARGSIRITDSSGVSTLVDLRQAVNINDVVNAINSATGVNVTASIQGDHLVLQDNAGGSGTLAVSNAGGTTTASDLGLTGAASGSTLTGTSLTKLTATTSLSSLNDGNGVRVAGGAVNDFSITGAAGTVDVSLSNAKTVGDVVKAINTAGQADGISAAISSDGSGIELTDSGGGPVTVAALNGSLAAYDLGIQGTSGTGTLTGQRVASTLTGPLLRDLDGGNEGQPGLTLPQAGTILINGHSVDLSNASSLQDVISDINASGQGVTASVDDSGTGIVLSSNAGSFTVADGTGNLASFLNISGTSTATATGSQIASGNLHERYISQNTLLSTLNGGTGFSAGSIQLTDGNGATVSLDLSSSSITTVGDVINKINGSGLAIKASVNSTGDGILLTQTAGTLTAKVQDINGGTTAASLGIAGVFTNNQLNGSFQKTVSISASDTLSNIASKINSANAGVQASIINDGSGADPYRLSLSSSNSGLAGRLTFDGSAVGLTSTTLVQGQNAEVIYGGNANGTGGLLSTSSTNAISNLIPGLTLNLTGVGSTTVNVTNDPSQIVTAVQNFVDSYNQVVNNIATVTAFDPNNSANNGLLFGDGTVEQVQDALGGFITQSYNNAGAYDNLSAVGITVNQDGTLTLDTDTLNQALATDPQDVQKLFTTNVQAVTGGPQTITSSTLLSSLNSNQGISLGQIQITDGFGTTYDVDLSSGVSTIGDLISKINAATGGKVTAGINNAGNGLVLQQVGGTGNASVEDINGGGTAAALDIAGTFSNNLLNGVLPPILPATAQEGVGTTLSNLIQQFTDSDTGLLFQASDSMQTQEQELEDSQNSLEALLAEKKNTLVEQFANLEVTISQLQSQGNALSSFKPVTSSSS